MAKKIPPPPFLTKDAENQRLNRWLLELTSILNSAGEVDPGSVAGLAALVIAVAAQGVTIAANAAAITALQTLTTAQGGAITALQGRPQVRNGVGIPAGGLGAVGDWYGDVTAAPGARVFIKTSVGVWTAFPF